MKRRALAWAVLVAGLLGAVWGCSGKGGASVSQEKAPVPPPVAVEAAAAAAADLVEGVDVTGTLTPKFEAEVKSEVVGLVREVNVTEWVRVRKGTQLARVDNRETDALVKKVEASVESARAGVIQAEVGANRAERELGRMQKLKEVGLATQQGLDDAGTEVAAARAKVEAAKAQLRAVQEELRQVRTRLSKALIRAPLDGVVALRDVNVGDLASDAAAAKPLFRIVDNRLLNLTVTVPSTEMAGLRVGQPLRFTTDALPGKEFAGRVMYINPAVNEADRSVKVVAEVPNVPETLKGGLFAKGRIVTGVRRGVIQVPRSALANWDIAARKGTLFVIEGETARQRPVRTGSVSGEKVEVAEGLRPGERFVVRGGFNLKDGSRVGVAR